MGVYDRQIANARRAIRAKGESCVWHVTPVAVVADVNKPWIETASGAPETTYPDTRILMLPLDRKFSELIRYFKGSDIVTGGLYGLMEAVAFVPGLTDIVERKDGSKLSIFSINPFAPNGDIIYYTIEFKA